MAVCAERPEVLDIVVVVLPVDVVHVELTCVLRHESAPVTRLPTRKPVLFLAVPDLCGLLSDRAPTLPAPQAPALRSTLQPHPSVDRANPDLSDRVDFRQAMPLRSRNTHGRQ